MTKFEAEVRGKFNNMNRNIKKSSTSSNNICSDTSKAMQCNSSIINSTSLLTGNNNATNTINRNQNSNQNRSACSSASSSTSTSMGYIKDGYLRCEFSGVDGNLNHTAHKDHVMDSEEVNTRLITTHGDIFLTARRYDGTTYPCAIRVV